MNNISNKIDKPKKTATELVLMLKNEKGIKFNKMDEQEAINYLSCKNNYLRTASYRKNYEKYSDGPNKNKYINLEFVYLTELSTIDLELRSILLKMCIDVEHSLKVDLMNKIDHNKVEDGYKIVSDFLEQNNFVKSGIENKADSIFTGDLINYYFELCTVFKEDQVRTKIIRSDCPAWVLLEIISFGNLIKFYDFYNEAYSQNKLKKDILNPIRSLRNACAHNNCLLNCMKPRRTKTNPPSIISQYVASIPGVLKEERNKKLTCRPIFETVCLLYVYTKIVSKNVRKARINELKTFCNERLVKNSQYFLNNQLITTSFEFLKKIVNNIVDT
ncbi:Abi family protein [Ruminococcaceae bacterium BL-4]|nr:Abi family protein [Ruminococcaceae bacterium BL-4]